MTEPALPSHSPALVPPSHHGHRSVGRWPLRTGLDLGPLPGAVPCARAHVQQVLWEWGHAELSADAGLAVSELVTNAVAATHDLVPVSLAPVRLWLASDTELVLILIGDASARPPLHVEVGPDSDSGRGLRLVEAVSGRWGWYPANAAGMAKVVWAEWTVKPAASQGPLPRRGHGR
jgi:anti-sigma regulatory factor (Ser/Thr protein kinase)